ncbi:tyrosinase family protein [Kitasatospora aureofaciens]|nr:tyrosinase family protein [Kitasatospora aureofaciens]
MRDTDTHTSGRHHPDAARRGLSPGWRAAEQGWGVVRPRRTRPSLDHRNLDQAGRDRFNQALKQVHTSGAYGQLAAVHADMSHRMHSMSGPVGTQRFLPWHRRYLLKLENLLRSVQPALTVPYWDYANDHARPDWGAPGDYRFSGKTGPGRAGPAARPGPLLPIQSFPR